MKFWLSFAVCIFLGTGVASAQFSIQPILDHGPIRFGLGIDVELNKFGSNVTASATVNAVLRDAQNLVLASLPHINKRLLCPDGRQRATISSMNFGPTFGGNDLILNVLLHVRECNVGLYEGDVKISIPLSVKKDGQSIVLAAAPLTIIPQGVSAFGGWVQVSDAKVKSSVDREVSPVMGGAIKKLNGWLASELRDASLQKLIKQYHFEIQSAQLALQGSDLAFMIKLSSQMSIAEADKRFSDLVPLNGSW